jgi:hypothetical protein
LLSVFLPPQGKAEEGARVVVRDVALETFSVNCWVGMKWGDQPGQLIRGWICERPVIAAPKTEQLGDASGAPKERDDVAAIGPVGVRR